MRRFMLLMIQLFVFGCTSNYKQDEGDKESIKTPTTIAKYSSQDSLVTKAIDRIKDYLVRNEPNDTITDFFVDRIEKRPGTVVVYVNHYDYYVVRDRVDKEFARIENLKKQGADS